MKALNSKTGDLSGYVGCAVVLTEDVMLHAGRVRFMGQSLLHNIAKLQPHEFTNSFETNHGQVVREPVP